MKGEDALWRGDDEALVDESVREKDNSRAMDRRALEARYLAALDEALGAIGIRARPRWMQPRLPRAIAVSMLVAQEIAGEPPEALFAHYLERMPRELVEQRLGPRDAARELLWRPLSPARLPGFSSALEGACAILREHGIDPHAILGASNVDELLEGNPSALELVQRSMLASGLPLLGAGAAERAEISRALFQSEPAHEPALAPDALLDRHLGQHLVHELLHGLAPRDGETQSRAATPGADWRDRLDPTDLLNPPWIVREAAALWLQSRAQPRHIFPELAGEAVPGVSLFVLAGEGLASALGADALLSSLSDPAGWSTRIGEPVAELLSIAEWQEWLIRKSAPFAQDALRAEAWSKLAAGARAIAEGPSRETNAAASPAESQGANEPREPTEAERGDPRSLESLRELAARAHALGVIRAARELPSLLDVAETVPWRALPAWHREPSIEDARQASVAIGALFQENALAPIFVTRPAELSDGRIVLDVDACRVGASRRSHGVFGEPARWTFPPSLCRELHARGAARIEIRGAKRAQRESIAAALVAIARGFAPLEAEITIDAQQLCAPEGPWTSSPR